VEREQGDPILQIESVCKRYGTVQVLHDVSLTLPAGVVGLLGPNGSGKSTLIKSMLGLVSIDRGRGRILGLDWPSQVRALRDQVGYLPEDDCYIQGLQGIESIQLMARLSGLRKREALRRSHEVADYCDLGQERYRKVETYSTGMRQKLKFAQALVHDPRWVILDEPTTGLDPVQREQFLDRINTLAREKGKSILLSTHILHDVVQTCDRVVILVGGRIRLDDTLEQLQRPSKEGFHVSVVAGAGRLADRLSTRGIESQVVTDGELVVSGSGEALGRQIWLASVESEVVVQRLDRAKNSLEQAFLDAVKG
jgi:ABC-2 type transport system ATP-binding protein